MIELSSLLLLPLICRSYTMYRAVPSLTQFTCRKKEVHHVIHILSLIAKVH